MGKNKFLLIAYLMFIHAAIAILAAYAFGVSRYEFWDSTRNTGSGMVGVDSGSDGGAVAFGIIAAALIGSGSFFLYKSYENKKAE